MKKVTFLNYKCLVDTSETYSNGSTAIQLIEEDTREPIAHATINMRKGIINKDEVVIKNYSENEGILDALIEGGVISKPLRNIPISEWVNAPVCTLL